MFMLLRTLSLLILFILPFGGVFAASGKVQSSSGTASRSSSETLPVSDGVIDDDTIEVSEKKARAVADMNSFLVDLYKPKVDKLIVDIETNTKKLSKGNPQVELRTYLKLADMLAQKIDLLDTQNLSANRKAVLAGVLGYMRDSIGLVIERKKQEITNSFDK